MWYGISFINGLLRKNTKNTSRTILHKFYKPFIRDFIKETSFLLRYHMLSYFLGYNPLGNQRFCCSWKNKRFFTITIFSQYLNITNCFLSAGINPNQVYTFSPTQRVPVGANGAKPSFEHMGLVVRATSIFMLKALCLVQS